MEITTKKTADCNSQAATFSGDSMADVVSKLTKSGLLHSVKTLEFNIITNTEAELKISDLSPIHNLMASLPDDVDVKWGVTTNPKQSSCITINIITKKPIIPK